MPRSIVEVIKIPEELPMPLRFALEMYDRGRDSKQVSTIIYKEKQWPDRYLYMQYLVSDFLSSGYIKLVENPVHYKFGPELDGVEPETRMVA